MCLRRGDGHKWDASQATPAVDLYFLKGVTGQVVDSLTVGTTGSLGSTISSDDMDRDGINEVIVTLYDVVNDKGIVKVLRSNGFEMNNLDVASPKSGMSVAVGQFLSDF